VFWAGLALSVFTMGVGFLTATPLLVADGITSAAFTTVVSTVILGLQMNRQKTFSKEYAYGKGKVQFITELLLGVLLTIAALIILGTSISNFRGSLVPPLLVFLRQAASRWARQEFRRVAQLLWPCLMGSLVVIQSHVLASYGSPVALLLGRISMSLVILWQSALLIKHALEAVMDRSGGEEIERMISALTASVENVEEVAQVRTRNVGQDMCIDIRVALDAQCTIAESDRVARRIVELVAARVGQPSQAVKVEFSAA
jgi:divalent metal cation (Fe/Co/Zn/Cd) transporter